MRHTLRSLVAIGIGIGALMSGCGGGDGHSERANVNALPDELLAAACAVCSPGMLHGQAAQGQALAQARVTVTDTEGRQVIGETDAQGHFALDVRALQPPLLLQVQPTRAGELPERWHAMALPSEVGRAWFTITPLTELIAAQVLQGNPFELQRAGQIELQRANSTSLRAAEDSLRALLWPMLNAAGLNQHTNLRTQAFAVDHTGIDGLLDKLIVFQADGGYRVRALHQSDADARLAGASTRHDEDGDAHEDGVQALPASLNTPPHLVLAEVAALLQQWTTTLQAPADDDSALLAMLAPGFLHQGMDSAQYVRHAQRALNNANWKALRIWRMPDAQRVEVAIAIGATDASPHRIEHMWLQRHADGWQLHGDQAHADIQVRWAHVLDAMPAATDAAGALASPLAGLMTLYTPAHADLGPWLTARALESQVLGQPSRRVTPHLLFAVDAQRVSPHIARILVKGPGLPASGLALSPSTDELAGQAHWSWATHPDDDWPALPLGWCPQSSSPGSDDGPQACADRWLTARAGASYRFELRDAQDQPVQTLSRTAPASPSIMGLSHVEALAHMPRLDVDEAPALQPTLRRLADATPPWRDHSRFRIAWRMPSDPSSELRPTELRLRVHGQTELEAPVVTRQHRYMLAARPGHLAEGDSPALAGAHRLWADWQLHSTDLWGNLHMHVLSPYNPR